MTSDAELSEALANLLTEAGWSTPQVTITGAASLGAQRRTLFIEVDCDGERTEAVAQVSTNVIAATPVTHEATLLGLAAEAAVPVPSVYAATNSLAGIERPAMVVSRLSGESVPRRVLRALNRPQDGDSVAADCGRALARLHAVDPSRVPREVDHIDPTQPFSDYCDRLDAILAALPTPHPAVRLGVNWLRRNQPTTTPAPSLVHGDFRNGNLLIQDGRLSAVLDWELAHVGDPMEDLAWLCLRTWRFGNDDRPVGGFGSLEALRHAYCDAGGTWREEAFRWWTAARTAWWACGLAGQVAAFTAGLSDSIVLAASGRRVPELEYDLLTLITADD